MRQTVDPDKEVLPTEKEIEMLKESIYQFFVNVIITQREQFGFSIQKAAQHCSIGRKELKNYECLDCNIGLNQWCKIVSTYILYTRHNHLEWTEIVSKLFGDIAML